jgi:hypothetical protein
MSEDCTRCGGSGFDPDPNSSHLPDGACTQCLGRGKEPCIICGDTGYDMNTTGGLVRCACRVEKEKDGNSG